MATPRFQGCGQGGYWCSISKFLCSIGLLDHIGNFYVWPWKNLGISPGLALVSPDILISDGNIEYRSQRRARTRTPPSLSLRRYLNNYTCATRNVTGMCHEGSKTFVIFLFEYKNRLWTRFKTKTLGQSPNLKIMSEMVQDFQIWLYCSCMWRQHPRHLSLLWSNFKMHQKYEIGFLRVEIGENVAFWVCHMLNHKAGILGLCNRMRPSKTSTQKLKVESKLYLLLHRDGNSLSFKKIV